MASNFTFRFQRNNHNLYIKLKGDLDGSSAQIVCDALRRNCDEEHKILVDTSGLRSVYPSGRAVLQNKLEGLKGKSAKILFTDENGAILPPEGI